MNYKWLVMSLILPFLILGCKGSDKETAGTPIYYYDPKIPGGAINPNASALSGGLSNFVADVTIQSQVTLKWKVAPMYKTMPHTVHIYKRSGATASLPGEPSVAANGAYLFELQAISTGVDTLVDSFVLPIPSTSIASPGVYENNEYTYWAYLEVVSDDGVSLWSSGQKIVLKASVAEDLFKFPSPEVFWNNYTTSLGMVPFRDLGGKIINISTLDAGKADDNKFRGSMATAFSGNLLYYADTENNRVVIFTRGEAHKCDDYKNTNDAMYYACVFQFSGYPFAAANVLGQVKQDEYKTCEEHQSSNCSTKSTQSSCEVSTAQSDQTLCSWIPSEDGATGQCSVMNKCLTRPSKVSVSGDRLFISDSGNNRIIGYNTLPTKGCIKSRVDGFTNAIDCNPSFVIGKKSLHDEVIEYPLGKASLKNPGGVEVKDGDLYIADTGNNRVVKVESFNNSEKFLCDGESNWNNVLGDEGFGSGKCTFSGLLGQPDYSTRFALKDTILCGTVDGTNQCNSSRVVSTGNFGGLRNLLDSDLLGRYFRAPMEVRFMKDGKLLVSANEDFSVTSVAGTAEMRGRILIWNSDPLSSSGEADPTKCTAGFYLAAAEENNFESSLNCQANSALGQTSTFNNLILVAPGTNYGSATGDGVYTLRSVDGFDIREKSVFVSDRTNNRIYYWEDLTTAIVNGNSTNPPTSRIENPNGALDTVNGGRYLPFLNSISDIKVAPNNLIYVSDPVTSKIYEVRSYEYAIPK